jgi:hypothetical protein
MEEAREAKATQGLRVEEAHRELRVELDHRGTMARRDRKAPGESLDILAQLDQQEPQERMA